MPQLFVIRIGDNGPGIANLQEILEGVMCRAPEWGLGWWGRRLVDQCEIHSDPKEGTRSLSKNYAASCAAGHNRVSAQFGRSLVAAAARVR